MNRHQIIALTDYDLPYYYELYETEYQEETKLVIEIRTKALTTLAITFNDPDTLAILKSRATTDEHYDVRTAAVQELARGFKDDPGMFEFLCDRALHDPFKREDYSFSDSTYEMEWQNIHPRYIALKAIIKQYPNHPQTLQILRDRTKNDPDKEIQKFAKQKLADL